MDVSGLTVDNIDAHFTIYKAKGGHQLQNSVQLVECLINSIYPETSKIILAEQHLWKAQIMASSKKLFKLLTNKAIIDNKQTTRKLQDHFDNCSSKMGDLDSNIHTFILFYRNITMMMPAQGKIISVGNEIATLLHDLLHAKE